MMVAVNTAAKSAVETLRFPEVTGPDGHRFWVGLTKDCPVQNAGPFAGVLFQKETSAIQRDAQGGPLMDERTGNTKYRDRDGNTALIDAETMAALARVVPETVIQSFAIPDLVDSRGVVVEANRFRCRVVRKVRFEQDAAGKWQRAPNPRYQRVENEVPLARFLYILPAEERGRYDDTTPPTVGNR